MPFEAPLLYIMEFILPLALYIFVLVYLFCFLFFIFLLLYDLVVTRVVYFCIIADNSNKKKKTILTKWLLEWWLHHLDASEI